MTDLPEPARLAAHVILDMAAAWDDDADGSANVAAMNLALRRMNETGAVKASLEDDDTLKLDMSDLLSAMGLVVRYLAGLAGVHARTSTLDMIAQARGFVDGEE